MGEKGKGKWEQGSPEIVFPNSFLCLHLYIYHLSSLPSHMTYYSLPCTFMPTVRPETYNTGVIRGKSSGLEVR